MKSLIEFGCWLILLAMLCCIPVYLHADMLKIGVIDTGINTEDPRISKHLCSEGHKDFTGGGLLDVHGHGTSIVGLIEQYAKKSPYCITMFKFWHNWGDPGLGEIDALQAAVAQKMNIINMSLGGSEYNQDEKDLICSHPEITFIVAAGNNGSDLSKKPEYPAAYGCPNEIVVGSIDQVSSNYGPATLVRALEYGADVPVLAPNGGNAVLTGTSQACGIHTGKYIYAITHPSK